MTQQMIQPMPEERDIFLTPQEVAAQLRVPKTTLYMWLANGLIPSVRLGRRLVRIRKVDLDAFLAASMKGREGA